MFDVLLTVLPVFLIMGAGYTAVRSGYLGDSIADALNAFSVKLAVPALLFAGMLRIDFRASFRPEMLTGFYVGAFSCFVIAIVLARTIWSRRPGEAVAVGFAATFSNTVLLGLPIIQQAYGAAGMEPAFAIISIHALAVYTVGITTMEMSRRDGRPFGETIVSAARSVFGNPLMISVLTGIAFNLLGLMPPRAIMTAIDLLAAAALPAALIGIGAALTRYQFSERLGEAATVSALALILHPTITLVITYYLFALPIEFVRAAVVMAAMPPGVNIYIFASMYDRGVQLAASTLLLSNMLSVLTISAWLYLVATL